MSKTPASTQHDARSHARLVERLAALAAEQAGVDRAQVFAHTRLVEDLNFDSLDRMEYAMEIEDEFAVSVDDAAAEKIKTVGDAAEVLAAALQRAGEA